MIRKKGEKMKTEEEIRKGEKMNDDERGDKRENEEGE
jgi:hypothetical protein